MPYQTDGKVQQTSLTLPREVAGRWKALRQRLGISNKDMAERLLDAGEKKLLAQRRRELEGSP